MGKAESIKIDIAYPIQFNADGKIIDLETNKEIPPHELYQRFGNVGYTHYIADRLLRKYPNVLEPLTRPFYDDDVRRFTKNLMEAMKAPAQLVAMIARDSTIFGVIRVNVIDHILDSGLTKVGFTLTIETFKAQRIEETFYHCDPALLKKKGK